MSEGFAGAKRAGSGRDRFCAAVLCGGAGTRLRKAVSGRPKPLALVSGVPFLDFLIAYLRDSGVTDIVLCTGYRSGMIERRYKKPWPGLRISVSREKRPLGTAGALKLAEPLICSDPFLVLNGDSICLADLGRLRLSHSRRKARGSILLTRNVRRDDVGSVIVNGAGLVTDFREKGRGGRGAATNAGVYLFNRNVLSGIPRGRKYSLEYELLPGLAGLYGFRTGASMLDIGTPERYALAEKILDPAKFRLSGRRRD